MGRLKLYCFKLQVEAFFGQCLFIVACKYGGGVSVGNYGIPSGQKMHDYHFHETMKHR